MLIIGGISLLLGGLLIFFGRRQKTMQSEMAKTKVLPINQLQTGTQAEVYGMALSSQPLLTPFSNRECVYYKYKLERQTEKRDARGQIQTHWQTITQDEKSVSFWIQDKTGKIAVDPNGADIDAQEVGEQFIKQNDISNFSILNTIRNSIGAYSRVTEHALFVNTPVYAMGAVTKSQETLMLTKGNGKIFLSYKTEEQVEKEKGRNAMLFTIFGGILLATGVALIILSFINT